MKHNNEMRERILNSVEELIATRGVNNFSLRDICDYLYISTGSLYYHFKTKDDIIMAIVDKHFLELENDYTSWLMRHREKCDLTKERFIDIILYKGTELFNRSKLHMYLINECMKDNEKLRAHYKGFIKSWYDKLLIGVKQVYGDREDIEGIAYTLFLILEGQTIRVALGDRRIEEEAAVKKLLKEL